MAVQNENAKFEIEKAKEIALKEALKEAKNQFSKKEREIRRIISEENEEAIKQLQEELSEKSNQVKELNKNKALISRLKREKDELEAKLKADIEREFEIKLNQARQDASKKSDEKFELKIKELEKKLSDQKELTSEMKRKQEQGSIQAQGEIQEIAIEQYLRDTFKYDEIIEVGKGDFGADSLQIVNSEYRRNCGKIYYESKRTKIFKHEWIGKFKNDIQEKGADIGVLVTAVYPKKVNRMTLLEGVYICTYEEFKALSGILRYNIIKISDMKIANENKHEKSKILYEYLTGGEFRILFENMVTAFVAMRDDLEKEKLAYARIWKKREKEIYGVLSCAASFYGSIQGISGNSIKKIENLEVPLIED